MNHNLQQRLEKSARITSQYERLRWIQAELSMLRLAADVHDTVVSGPPPALAKPPHPIPAAGGGGDTQVDLFPAGKQKPQTGGGKAQAGRPTKDPVREFHKQSIGIVEDLKKEVNAYKDQVAEMARNAISNLPEKMLEKATSALDPLANLFGANGRVRDDDVDDVINSSQNVGRLNILKTFTGNAANPAEFYQKGSNLASILGKLQHNVFSLQDRQGKSGVRLFTENVVMAISAIRELKALRQSLKGATPDPKVVSRVEKQIQNREDREKGPRGKVNKARNVVSQLAGEAKKLLAEKAKDLYGKKHKKEYKEIRKGLEAAYGKIDWDSHQLPRASAIPEDVISELPKGKSFYKGYMDFLRIAKGSRILDYAAAHWQKIPEEKYELLSSFPDKAKGVLDRIKSALDLEEEADPFELTRKKEKKKEEEEAAEPEEEAAEPEEEEEDVSPSRATRVKPEKRKKKKKDRIEPVAKPEDVTEDEEIQSEAHGTDAVEAAARQMENIESHVQKGLDSMVEFLVDKASKMYKGGGDFDLQDVLRDNLDEFYTGGIVDIAINRRDSSEYRKATRLKNTDEDFDYDRLAGNTTGKTIIRMYRTVLISARILGILQFLGDRPKLLLKSSKVRKKIEAAVDKLKRERHRYNRLQMKLISTRKSEKTRPRKEASVKK